MTSFPHLDESGEAKMVDVGGKDVTERSATARGRLAVSREVVDLLRRQEIPKGDALAVARVAAITGAKRTADLIPLCHPIRMTGVDVELEVTDDSIEIEVTCRAADRTGVEMEALTGVAIAGLTLHDMVKAIDPSAVMTDVRLVAKSGGRHGEWRRA